MPISFSPIQNHILTQLKNAKSLRYSEMKPKAIPNDLFNYHLQFLVKKGFVEKTGGKTVEKAAKAAKTAGSGAYCLSEVGVRHVADAYPLNKEEEKNASLFKINVITIVSRVVQDPASPRSKSRKGSKKIQILNQIRGVHPSYGKIGVPGGVVRKGEPVLAAATRKLEEETGLVADFNLLGFERRMMYVQHELFSDVLFPIAYSDQTRGELLAETKFGKNMWVDIDQAIQHESAEFDSLVKIRDVLLSIKKGKDAIKKLPFFYEEKVQSDV
ncbi:MAG: hypothetical protein RIT04_333 [Candidatus Parcubacteria bacterium]|jgi:8-oxo-dGTP pyrophosphatase MutT (NUDIX family)